MANKNTGRLIHEFWDFDNKDFEILKEDDESKQKKMKIKGPFLVSEERNKNGRVYSKKLIEREVERFNKDKIAKRCAYGAVDHPNSAVVSLGTAAIHIDELYMDGNIAVGKATILSTNVGKDLTRILDDGYSFGVSSRGIGNLDPDKNVQDNYRFITEDVVSDPSADKCWVEGILESKEYIISGDDFIEQAVEKLQEQVDTKFNSSLATMYLKQFIQSIRKGN
jgi:hypothetical protein